MLQINQDPDLAAEAIRQGASCYLLKNSAASELWMAVDEAMHGRSYVTPLVAKGLMEALANESPTRKHLASPRQREVLQLLAEKDAP